MSRSEPAHIDTFAFFVRDRFLAELLPVPDVLCRAPGTRGGKPSGAK